MINPATGDLLFNAGAVHIGPGLAPGVHPVLRADPLRAPDPGLVRSMRTEALSDLSSAVGGRFDARLDFLGPRLTGVRLMARGPAFPPDLRDWDIAREMARHKFHCDWTRGQLGWLWRVRRYPWGRVRALCGENLQKKPEESILQVLYVEFEKIEETLGQALAPAA